MRTRDRLLDAALAITTAQGWAQVTMAKVAAAGGVSRQTVYNELGTKDALAQALVARETGRFLELVAQRLRAEQADIPAAVAAAVRTALEHGAGNELIAAAVQSADGDGTGLLPLLTARPELVLQRSVAALAALAEELWAERGLRPAELHELMDTVVRLTLSHLVQPVWPAEHTAAVIGRLVRAVLVAG